MVDEKQLDQPTQTEQPLKPGEKFGYLRNEYSPHRNSADEILRNSGMTEETKGFRKARRKLGEKIMETSKEGEIDELTGLLNEKGFNRRYNEEAERIKRFGEKATILYLDVNNLKILNDSEGHEVGDELLKAVASTLRKSTRLTDIVARLHGDEFVVILTATDLETTKTLFEERLNPNLKEQNISIAIGAAEINPNDLDGSKKKADDAMYVAKEKSKEGVKEGEMAKASVLQAA